MNSLKTYKEELIENGFSITKPIFSSDEIEQLLGLIGNSDKTYAKRQLINKTPEIKDIIFNNYNFSKLYHSICDSGYFLSKAIFFNKPKMSNWFVSYHQDISISASKKIPTEGFSKWTNKDGQLGVIPPQNILENTITFRLHLDHTDNTNGALKVIKGSHKNGLIRIDENFKKGNLEEQLCNVEKGAIMLMQPLLLHASDKSTSEFDRRVIHLEFCNKEIPMGWLEKKQVV
jgi:ectoine hydroxylase-related dioxygenase (phytanoyl-CoA dioxygenase family)